MSRDVVVALVYGLLLGLLLGIALEAVGLPDRLLRALWPGGEEDGTA